MSNQEGQARRGRPPMTDAARFKDLPPEWKAKVDHLRAEEINAEIVEVTKQEKLNQLDKKESDKVAEAKEAYDDVVAPFKDASKTHKAKIEYMLNGLKNMGKL